MISILVTATTYNSDADLVHTELRVTRDPDGSLTVMCPLPVRKNQPINVDPADLSLALRTLARYEVGPNDNLPF